MSRLLSSLVLVLGLTQTSLAAEGDHQPVASPASFRLGALDTGVLSNRVDPASGSEALLLAGPMFPPLVDLPELAFSSLYSGRSAQNMLAILAICAEAAGVIAHGVLAWTQVAPSDSYPPWAFALTGAASVSLVVGGVFMIADEEQAEALGFPPTRGWSPFRMSVLS